MSAGDHTELPVLVGRDSERALLREALDQARAGCGGAVFVVGGDGLGKSRLTLEATHHGRQAGMAVLVGRAGSTGRAVALRPLTEALAPLSRTEPVLEHASLRPYRSALGRLIPQDLSVGTAGPPSPVLLAEAVLRLLSVTGAGRGCLLALEDLHDTDPATLAVVEYLADNLADQGVLLLATLRAEPGPAWDLAQALGRRCSGTVLRLEPLSRRAVRLLVASRLGLAPERIAEPVLDRLCRDSAGNPFLAAELLRAMLDSGNLVVHDDGCRLVDGVPTEVPPTVRRSVTDQADRLGPAGRHLLTAAAVIGERFPVSVLGLALKMGQDDLLRHLRAAVTAGLVTAEGGDHDWYAFRTMTTAVALLGQLTPTDRAALAHQAVDAVNELHPGLPGDWCRFTARLTRLAGDVPGAVRLLALAGRRDLNAGRLRSAADTLDGAWRLAAAGVDVALRADVLHELLCALLESGEAGRGLRLLDSLDDLCHPAVPPERLAAVHVLFARLALLAGRRTDAAAQLDSARTLLGPGASERQTAPVDAVAAHLGLDAPGRATRLATRAAAAAESAGLPGVACLGWQARGVLARRTGPEGAQPCFTRMRRIAERHHLPLWRTQAAALLAEQRWLLTGDADALARSAERARQLGAHALRHAVDVRLAWDHALRAEYAEAERLVEECTTDAQRLGLGESAPLLSLVRAVCAGHRGRRHELDAALAGLSGDGEPVAALAHGMAAAVCALLEEDPARARRELDRAAAYDAGCPAPYPLAGQHGLALLLAVLPGDADRRLCGDAGGTPAGRLHWNRQFVLLARAVLLGRRGDREAAGATVAALRRTPTHPVALHLGLRLVAPCAHADRWGEPVDWLRGAEEYFRLAGVPAPARACRAQLRDLGVVVPHRRIGSRVPQPLRMIGVTEREYEVLQLMADWSDNRSIASELFISPRTVEKHVASLIAKTEQANRAALSRYAARVREEVRPD
ncbi:helix-turn-helix transcriptional regulator [Micromonospora haikouensis]|uniref:helix-turn-helix transcriptional regulator n=1 Tax=Micromonospora haikouensis TaxID=686309 RepID=UPI0006991176|nr:LuxR family transcriptional regulator [Micromonospora haikouensis]